MTRFIVLLEVRRRGACVGSTEDVVEAVDAAEAEELAVERWKAARASYSFAPLLTVTAERPRAKGQLMQPRSYTGWIDGKAHEPSRISFRGRYSRTP